MYMTLEEAKLDNALVDDFKGQIRGEVVLPTDANYDNVRLLSNKMHDKRPAVIARCLGVSDVIAAINFARQHNLRVAVRGGGHNVAGSGARLMMA